MNALAVRPREELAQAVVAEALKTLAQITSWEAAELLLLRGTGLSGNSIRAYVADLRSFAESTGNLHPLQTTISHVDRWFDQLLAKGSRATADRRVAGLKRCLRELHAMCPLVPDVFDSMSEAMRAKLKPKHVRGDLPEKMLTTDEARALLAWLAKDKQRQVAYVTIKLLLATGLRSFELVTTTWGDVKEDPYNPGAYTLTGIGKGSLAYRQECTDPAAIDAARRLFRRQHHRDPRVDDALVWIAPGQPLRARSLHRMIVATGAAAAAVVTRPVRWSPHTFRHTAATMLLDNGMSLRSVQRFLRHTSVTTTEIYTHAHQRAADFDPLREEVA